MALLIVAALVVVQALGWWFHGRERARELDRQFAVGASERVLATLEILDAARGSEEVIVLHAVNGRGFRVTRAPGPPPARESIDGRAEAVREAVTSRLGSLGERAVVVHVPRPWADPRRPRGDRPGRPDPPPLARHARRLVVGIEALDRGWWVFRTTSRASRPPLVARATFWIVGTGVLVLLGSLWLSRRLTRPLVELAAAADRFGADVRAPPLAERGSGELRRTTRAFNRMQDRLRRFVDDRTRTLAAISHDLCTGLTRLRLRAEYIEDPEQREKAFADLDEMRVMLDATLAFARDDAAAEARVALDLAALLQTLVDDAVDAGGRVAYRGPDHRICCVRPVALRRALGNLVDNAVRYGGAAEVELAVGVPGQEDEARIVVRDPGPGIPPGEREKVFEPFYRVERSRSRDTGGTGLGLSVARDIARGHGGDIRLEDGRDGGFEVHVVIACGGRSGRATLTGDRR